jgi:PAS domain S-box-containing protein
MSDERAGIGVLHVDDDPQMGDLTVELLEAEDPRFEVTTVGSVDAALDRLAADAFDCVVSDYEMPVTDGLAFLETVREEYGDLPFILFTGKGSEEVASEALSKGATDYLQKEAGTSQYDVLANRIENAVGQYRAEAAVERTETRYQRLIEASTDAILVVDNEGQFQYLSPATERVLGYPPADLEGEVGFDYVHPDDRERAATEFAEVVSTPSGRATIEFRFRQPDGEFTWLGLRARNLLDDPVIGGIVVYARDITARKERERELERQERIIETVSDGVYALDETGTYTYVNRYVEELSGYDRSEIIGTEPGRFLPTEAVDRLEAGIASILRGERETVTDEFDLQPATGNPIPVEVRLAPLTEDGTFRGTVGVLRDVSDRREREERLRRQNERLDEFASVVSHDLRNPMNTLRLTLELMEAADDPDQFDRCYTALDRMERLVDDLLTLAKEGDRIDSVAPVDLAETVEAAWQTAGAPAGTLSVEADCTVQADADRLRQLLENLLANAVEHGSTGSQNATRSDDAVEHGSTSPDSQARQDAVEHGPGDAGSGDATDSAVSVRVGRLDDGFYVADDGPGVPASERDEVFESGYTTTEGGTGFGLAIVRTIAEAHGWTVGVTESEAGGARFEVRGVSSAD